MGLLDKAVTKGSPEADKKASALRDRLLRLSPSKSAPYTALSLLKANGLFQIGACLSLRSGTYESYAAVGLGIGKKVSIPQPALTGGREGFYRAGEAAGIAPSVFSGEGTIWTYTLDDNNPGESVLMVFDPSGDFVPDPLDTLLADLRHVLIPPGAKAIPEAEVPAHETEITGAEVPADDTPVEIAADTSDETVTDTADETVANTVDETAADTAGEIAALREELAAYMKDAGTFTAILLEPPGDAADDRSLEEFHDHVSKMTVYLGRSFRLPSKRSLILSAQRLDRELICHRLAKSLNTAVLAEFEADDPDEAVKLIEPCL